MKGFQLYSNYCKGKNDAVLTRFSPPSSSSQYKNIVVLLNIDDESQALTEWATTLPLDVAEALSYLLQSSACIWPRLRAASAVCLF